MDAVADVTAVCMLIEKLAPDQIIASPVHVGAGTVKCAHGILPVPAPATALILKDVPIYGGAIQSELCTPTGAALLKHFVRKFESMPVMKIKRSAMVWERKISRRQIVSERFWERAQIRPIWYWSFPAMLMI
jgi:uncharacterized protein (DUF111 family)